MFDLFSRDLFEVLPDLPGLTPDDARRALSRAYLAVVNIRTGESIDADALSETVDFVRRLADTIEFYAVLGDGVEPAVRRAGAFIAAESLALLADLYDHESQDEMSGCRLRHNRTFVRVEAGILYMIAGYDANAASVVNGIPTLEDMTRSTGERSGEWALELIIRLCRFNLNPLPERVCPISFEESANLNTLALEDDTVGRLYGSLGEAVSCFTGWLAGDYPEGVETADQKLNGLVAALAVKPPGPDEPLMGMGGDFTRISHLSILLKVCLPKLRERALIRLIPPGPGFGNAEYGNYLKRRAVGDGPNDIGRPVVWPSARDYVEKCITGDAKHAVVSMPTGSGKSFVAELALSQAIGDGWALYLAPTNALTQQIRQDLREAMKSLGTDVLAFIGDREYSALRADVLPEMSSNSVAVMTPEKASLALRLYPDVFQSCRLVVFDECHLIGETSSGRGVTAELVLSHLMLLNPDIRILLMSAIVQNPEDLTGWLTAATGHLANVVKIPWRPTRALRSALGVDLAVTKPNIISARQAFETMGARRKNSKFHAAHNLVCGLQGAWQSTDSLDYGIVPLSSAVELKVTRTKRRGDWEYRLNSDGWVNASAIATGSLLAESGIQTMVFIQANRHHAFGNALKTDFSEECKGSLAPVPSYVATCRQLAEYEFGCPSTVFELLEKGVSVHTSHMIETEKIGSEEAFRNNASRLMYATGTLAQGLNLPATAVVIAGTRIGDPRGEEPSVTEQRKRSQLLNAAGRAGRAGFANQGLVVAVPDKPVFVNESDAIAIRQRLEFLRHQDDAVEVSSPLESFLDRATVGLLEDDTASATEMQVIAALAGGDVGQPGPAQLLSKTYAFYRRKTYDPSDVSRLAGNHLLTLRDRFIARENAPPWLPIAAQRGGIDYFLALQLVQSWERLHPEMPTSVHSWTVLDWVDELLRIGAQVHPTILLRSFPVRSLVRMAPQLENIAERHVDLRVGQDDWTPGDDWVEGWTDVIKLLRPWMEGKPLVDVATALTGTSVNPFDYGRNAGGKPIPKTIALTNDSFAQLALLAGGIVAIIEQFFGEFAQRGNGLFDGGVPLALNSLPMCIKYGCDSPRSLAWYRFGVRLRRPSRLLFEAFPPPEIDDDDELRDWISQQRADWLRGELDVPENLLRDNGDTLNAIAGFIRSD